MQSEGIFLDLSEHELACIIESNPSDFAVFRMVNGTPHLLYASEALPAYTGLDAPEFAARMQQNATSFIVAQDRQRVEKQFAQIVKGRRDFDDCFRIFHSTRGFVWLHIKARVIGKQAGCPLLLMTLLNSSSETIGHMDHASGMVYVVDRENYELLYANALALEMGNGGDFCGCVCYDYIAHRKAPCPWCTMSGIKNGLVHKDEVYLPLHDRWFRIDGQEIDWYGRRAIAFYNIDVTEEKMQKQSLEIDKMDLEEIIGNLPVGVSVSQIRNGNLTPVAMNPYIYELLNAEPQDFALNRERLLEYVHPEDKEKIVAYLHSLGIPGLHNVDSFRFLNPDGQDYRWLRITERSVQQGEGVMAFACLTDISAEKEAEAEISKSRRMYEAAVETARLGVWEYDIRRHRMLLSDKSFTHNSFLQSGASRVIENMPEATLQCIDEQDRDKVLAMYRALEEGAPRAECECWYRQQPGQEPRCEHIVYTTVFDGEGKPLVAYGIGSDITVRKLKEEKYSRLYRQFAGASPNLLGTFRQNLTQNWCGDGQCSQNFNLPLPQSGTVDDYFSAIAAHITDPAIRDEFSAKFRREALLSAFRTGITKISLALPLLFPDGDLHWIENYVNMVQNPKTGDVEALTYALNITERKKDESIIRVITNESCDYIALIDVKKQTLEFRNVNRDISSKPQSRTIDYNADIRDNLSRCVAPGDRKLFAACTALPYLIDKLSQNSSYTFSYTHIEGKKRLRKQLRYSYLEDTKREILVIRTDITTAYEQEQQLCRM
jgi:PAS domain-containing protein